MPPHNQDTERLRRALAGLLLIAAPACTTPSPAPDAHNTRAQQLGATNNANRRDNQNSTNNTAKQPAGTPHCHVALIPKGTDASAYVCPAQQQFPRMISRCRVESWTGVFDEELTSTARARQKVVQGGALCCYLTTPPKPPPRDPRNPDYRVRRPCGRAFEVREEMTVAEVGDAASWREGMPMVPRWLTEATRARAGAAWLSDGLEEHASIAAFQRAALELMALGAPPELLAGYHRAALEEIDHARRCFAMASALLGREVGPGRLEVEGPRGDLDALIRDTFLGGCVGETVAALCALRAAEGCAWTPAHDALQRIAEDETAHAALAWSTLHFLRELHPERVRTILLALRPDAPTDEGATDSDDPHTTHATREASADETSRGMRQLGRLTPAQEHRAARDAAREIVLPMWRELVFG